MIHLLRIVNDNLILLTQLTFSQSSFFVHYSPDHFAIPRSILDEDTFDLPAAAVVVLALSEHQLVVQLVAVVAMLLLGLRVQQHIAAVAGLDRLSLARDSVVVVRIECAA